MNGFLQQAPQAVYIHIPFCTNKCHYCDFNSYVLKGQPVTAYLDALQMEMERTVALIPPQKIKTVFVGGGTPTVLTPEQMQRFLSLVHHYFPLDSAVEFSMEANPGTTDAEKLQAMKSGGVNRISFGVQSFDNRLLQTIGRIHNTDDVYNSIENAKQAGFENISIDLMFGLPEQTSALLNHSLDEALKLNLQHYSVYGLKVEENTLFHKMYERNQLPLPDEDEELDMFLSVMEKLGNAGFKQYEISNFALAGKESRHNLTYWKNEAYYGLGAGAHGYAQRMRHVNVKGVQPYIDAAARGLPRLERHEVSEEEAMEDFMMVGLRVLEGVKDGDFQRQFNRSFGSVFGQILDSLQKQKLLETTDRGYRLTKQGLLYGNEVFARFVGNLV